MPGERGVALQRGLELARGSVELASAIERDAEPQARRKVARRGLHDLAVRLRRERGLLQLEQAVGRQPHQR